MNENTHQDSAFYRLVRGIFDYLELFAFSVAAVLLIFTFGIRTCQVDGQSMENTLFDKQYLIIRSLAYEPEQDDIIVFHGMDKTLVKRVIAVGGQEIIINTNPHEITVDGVVYAPNQITVDGVPYEDSHSVLKNPDPRSDTYDNIYRKSLFYSDFDHITGVFRTTVPEGKLFVMGDNRNNSTDSRSPLVGFVDERYVLGKVFLRISPFTVFS